MAIVVKHNVSIISMIIGGEARLRFEVSLNKFDIKLSRKLRLMGFNYIGKGIYIKELHDLDQMKNRYEFNMEFLNREFGKKNVQIYRMAPVAS